MPMLVLVVVALLLAQDRTLPSDLGRFDSGGSIKLRMEYTSGWDCDLALDVGLPASPPGAGVVSLSCAQGRQRTHRSLRSEEVKRVLQLARDSQLFSARGVGTDGRSGNLWLATLTVKNRGHMVMLVISGNPEFDSGPRSRLMDFLRNLLVELRRRLQTGRNQHR
jgi:hypothetical protein